MSNFKPCINYIVNYNLVDIKNSLIFVFQN